MFTVDLTINTVDTTVSISGFVIQSNASNATYQWLDCSLGYAPIPSETNALFTPLNNGSYAVQVTQNGCVDTSRCQSVEGIGFKEKMEKESMVLFPNPTTGICKVTFGNVHSSCQVYLLDAQARVLLTKQLFGVDHFKLNIEALPPGLYFIHLTSPGHPSRVAKVLKQ